MKKIIIAILVLVLLSALYWMLSPFWRTVEVKEDLPTGNQVEQFSPVILKSGLFTGFDKVHTGSGTASLVKIGDKSYIRFEEDFIVNNGPDLYVGLGENGKYIKGSELGLLKGTKGSQNYELPIGINPEDVKEVWVWCKAFAVPFTKAEFK